MNSSDQYSLKIFDTGGRTIIDQKNSGNKVSVNINALKSGLYILQIEDRRLRFNKE